MTFLYCQVRLGQVGCPLGACWLPFRSLPASLQVPASSHQMSHYVGLGQAKSCPPTCWLPFRCLLATLQVPASSHQVPASFPLGPCQLPLGPCQLPLGPCQLPLGPCQLPFRSLMDILQNLTVKTVLSVSIFVLQSFLSATKIFCKCSFY